MCIESPSTLDGSSYKLHIIMIRTIKIKPEFAGM
jgi:hypothetical protein